MIKLVRTALMILFLFTILTGFIYPLVVTGIAQLLFPVQANGSVIVKDGRPIGSELLGQQFDDPKYFWSRPSATTPYPYNGGSSSGSNLGPGNPDLVNAVKARVKALRDEYFANEQKIPVDLVTASGSGLDPHISPAAAEYQVRRVAKARGINEEKIRALVSSYTDGRQLGIFGEPVVNVLRVNLALDELDRNEQGRDKP